MDAVASNNVMKNKNNRSNLGSLNNFPSGTNASLLLNFYETLFMQNATITTLLTKAKGHVCVMGWHSCPQSCYWSWLSSSSCQGGCVSVCVHFLFWFFIFPPSLARTHTFYLSTATNYWGLSLIHVESTAHQHLLNGPTETLIPLLNSAI